MLCLSSAAALFPPADPASRGTMASQQMSFHTREFDHFVVIDFEATCEKNSKIYPQEIIEFAAVLVDAATGGLVASFRTYVKPRHHPRLTAFCSELTGIQQEQVDDGVDLATALAMHDEWLAAAGAAKNRLAVVTWGDWDCRTMLESECSFKGLAKPAYFDRWINLRIPFEVAFGAGRRNLQEAVREAGLQWNGRLHCGLDDARNTACLLAELMRRGVPISITGSLVPPPPPEPEPELQLQQQLLPANHNFRWCVGGAAATDCCCYCGVAVRGDVVTTPGPMQGRCFFSCGTGRRWGLCALSFSGRLDCQPSRLHRIVVSKKMMPLQPALRPFFLQISFFPLLSICTHVAYQYFFCFIELPDLNTTISSAADLMVLRPPEDLGSRKADLSIITSASDVMANCHTTKRLRQQERRHDQAAVQIEFAMHLGLLQGTRQMELGLLGVLLND